MHAGLRPTPLACAPTCTGGTVRRHAACSQRACSQRQTHSASVRSMATTSRATAALHDDTLGTRIVAAGQRSGVLTRDAPVDLLCSRLCKSTYKNWRCGENSYNASVIYQWVGRTDHDPAVADFLTPLATSSDIFWTSKVAANYRKSAFWARCGGKS